MNIVKSSRSSGLPKAADGKSSSVSTNINLYQEIPNIEVSLDDFEEFALDRLKVWTCFSRYALCEHTRWRDSRGCLWRFRRTDILPLTTTTILLFSTWLGLVDRSSRSWNS
jgi:hypothetical protein